jgi:hypothetical protein
MQPVVVLLAHAYLCVVACFPKWMQPELLQNLYLALNGLLENSALNGQGCYVLENSVLNGLLENSALNGQGCDVVRENSALNGLLEKSALNGQGCYVLEYLALNGLLENSALNGLLKNSALNGLLVPRLLPHLLHVFSTHDQVSKVMVY